MGPIDLVLYFVMLVPLFLVVFDGIHRLGFLVVVHWPRKPGEGKGNTHIPDLRLLMLISAHNEQSVIGESLKRIRDQVDADSSTRIVVIADHCSDQTASIASGGGASVYVRNEGLEGKAQALSWFVHGGQDLLCDTDIVAVLDADTLADADFCVRIRGAFDRDVDAVQGFVNPVYDDGFPLPALASYSEILAQRIDDTARSRLNWSVPLRGTGMAFRTGAFCRACEGLDTQVDDIELSLRLAKVGIQVHFCPEAAVHDAKSHSLMGLARQRARWLRGQRQIWRQQWATILKLLRSGPPSWSLIHALLLKPKTALILIKAALISILVFWPFYHSAHQVILLTVVGTLFVDCGYYLSGLQYVSYKRKYLAALIGSPLLIALWGLSWTYSLLPSPGWIRARGE
jgi:cellulose synthase/poly-beta-1,6-N-acetylglucosamine synthase-like glycosyltransferase